MSMSMYGNKASYDLCRNKNDKNLGFRTKEEVALPFIFDRTASGKKPPIIQV